MDTGPNDETDTAWVIERLRSAVANLKKQIPDWKEWGTAKSVYPEVQRAFVALCRQGDMAYLPPEDVAFLAVVRAYYQLGELDRRGYGMSSEDLPLPANRCREDAPDRRRCRREPAHPGAEP